MFIMPHNAYTGEEGCDEAPVTTHRPPSVKLYVYCDNVDERYKRACEKGFDIIQPLDLRFLGRQNF